MPSSPPLCRSYSPALLLTATRTPTYTIVIGAIVPAVSTLFQSIQRVCEWFWLCAVPNIKWMCRKSVLVDLKAIRSDPGLIQNGDDLFSTAQVLSMFSPSDYEHVCVLNSFNNMPVIFRSDGVWLCLHVIGVGCTVGKNIDDLDTPATFGCSGPAFTAFNSRIIFNFVCSAWIQHQKTQQRLGRIPYLP